MIEKFICILYISEWNERSIVPENWVLPLSYQPIELPPTQEIFFQHVLLSVYQASINVLLMPLFLLRMMEKSWQLVWTHVDFITSYINGMQCIIEMWVQQQTILFE